MIESLLTVVSAAKNVSTVTGALKGVFDLYGAVTGVKAGGELRRTQQELAAMRARVERVSDRVLWAPDAYQVRTETEVVKDGRLVREFLDPVASALKTDLLSTAVLQTPSKFRRELERNPFHCLMGVCPIELLSDADHPGPGMVPIMFDWKGQLYIGW